MSLRIRKLSSIIYPLSSHKAISWYLIDRSFKCCDSRCSFVSVIKTCPLFSMHTRRRRFAILASSSFSKTSSSKRSGANPLFSFSTSISASFNANNKLLRWPCEAIFLNNCPARLNTRSSRWIPPVVRWAEISRYLLRCNNSLNEHWFISLW